MCYVILMKCLSLSLPHCSSICPDCNVRRHHFQCMLLDHIDAPPPVLSYLCNKYNIHNIPIAGELSAAEIEEVCRESCGCVLCIGYTLNFADLWYLQFERSLPKSVTFMRYFTDSTEVSLLYLHCTYVQSCPWHACMRVRCICTAFFPCV